MDPLIDGDWLGFKNEAIDEPHSNGNIARSWQWRERGINPPNSPANKIVLENIAEDILVQKSLKIRSCDLPGYPRSTFLMVFSPDGTKVASTHGNHNVYVSELASGKHVRILKGHPRTPWCIAFHPSHPQLIGSGCLGGQVRVWDISSGGSEVWNVSSETVIASIAFHPREQLLVIATYNELYFWDWSQPAPFTKVSTNNINEKVRYVAFDSLGYKLITGISLRISSGAANASVQNISTLSPNNNQSTLRRDDPDDNSGNNRTQDNSGSTQDIIVNSYQNLVQRYDSLVRNYQRLFMVRHRLTVTPPPPSTTDRGTDPMETDPSPESNSFTRTARSYTSTTQYDDDNTSSSNRPGGGSSSSTDGDGPSSRYLNLEALSFDNVPFSFPNSSRSEIGSRPSAFQPLNDMRRPFRTVDQSERSSRLLPNPFSSTNTTPRPSRFSYSNSPLVDQSTDTTNNSSRTSIFPAYRPENSSVLDLSPRRLSTSQRNSSSPTRESVLTDLDNTPILNDHAQPSTSTANSADRPTTSNSPSQSSSPVDAQDINASLDLIRAILRDSGTRLLNLITNMSLSTLANAERNTPRRRNTSRAHSDDNEPSERQRSTRPRMRLFSISLHQDFISSTSDSDSDQSPEVNILRTRNSTFRENDLRYNDHNNAGTERAGQPTDRLVFELEGSQLDDLGQETGGFNVSANSSRFHVRTQNNTTDERPTTSNRDSGANGSQQSQNNVDFDPNRPSTSRDNFWSGGPVFPPEEACRKVKGGVNALQKHTTQLTNMWLRGNRVTMRELRVMWDNLRRQILTLHRETGRQDVPSYYTRSLVERCMMLTDMSENVSRGSSRTTRINQRSHTVNTDLETNDNTASNGRNSANSDSRSSRSRRDHRISMNRASQRRHSPTVRSIQSFRRRLQANYRWRPEDELRRRSRNSAATRLSQRYSNRPRREFARAIEISATRHLIRMRAMQVLSAMFNMMMMCLEERGLNQLIINMLKTLKKALALTCLMLMTNRNGGRNSNTSPQRVDSVNVIRLENIDHAGPINVDGPDESPQNSINNEAEEERLLSNQRNTKQTRNSSVKDTQTKSVGNNSQEISIDRQRSDRSNNNMSQRWSNRLAVQIAAANRNYSATARNRRDLYMESKRLRALHRTNPVAHPLVKRKVQPPMSTYKIPALRLLPTKRIRSSNLRNVSPQNEPIPGPSRINPNVENTAQEPSRLPPDMMNEFEHRINLLRRAHMQAVRLRNAARSRFRRLQTIRLYTPSSVREMFSLPSSNDNPQENVSPLHTTSEPSNRTPSAWHGYNRPYLLARERIFHRSPLRHSEESAPYQVMSPTIPRMQVGEPSGNTDNQANQPQRLPRIHEYLQPIILAQNAMVVDDEGNADGGGGGSGGGPVGANRGFMAGLFDAGIISEALPAPSHRVQAWDFTKGDTPNIADSTKNVVVQRCRIHNDASIDISKDGRLLVALLPVPRLRNTNHWLGVYSLEWGRLGQCLYTAALEQSAVSVALSPTARHLAVGLGARRFSSAPARTNVFALLYCLDPLENSSRTGLTPIKELEQTWEHGFTSLNCLRWAPQPGQGLVYANNTGQLIIMS